MKKEKLRYCKKCNKKTEHLEHGFKGSNYRETCKICDTINYTNYEL